MIQHNQALASEDLREHQDMAILLLSSTHYKSDPTSSVRAWNSELVVYPSAFKRHTSHRRRAALESRWNADARCARFGTPLQLSTTIKFSRFNVTTHYRNAFKLYVLGLSYDPGPHVGGSSFNTANIWSNSTLFFPSFSLIRRVHDLKPFLV